MPDEIARPPAVRTPSDPKAASRAAPRAGTPAGDGACPADDPAAPTLTVYFDGACPVCSREVAAYRRRGGADTMRWVDAASCAPESLGPDLDRETALARMHVRRADGTLVAGAAAFAAMWRELPALAPLGRIAGWPIVRPVLDAAYAVFLALRPAWRPTDVGWPPEVVADLRTDHAGEAGATWIYRGILTVSRDASTRAFASRHLLTEIQHLEGIESVLPWRHRSRLLPLWRIAGWLTGALPALVGPGAVHATIDAVETFVDGHYGEQLERLDAIDPTRSDARLQALRAMIAACRDDERSHRDESRSRLASLPGRPGVPTRLWTRAVGAGSAAAVATSRRI